MKSPIQRQLEIFSAALELSAGPMRDAYLAQTCAGDHGLRQCVDALLASHTDVGSFLGKPAGPVGPTGTHLLPSMEKPGDKIGRYKLLQQIGEGGCGTVYMAEQEDPIRRRVALKVIRLGMDTKNVVARFEAERQALALMDHPHIAKVFDGGATESGRPYFVMELVRGIKITDYCDRAGLNTQGRLQLFIQVCQAVQHAHQKGIIHRDIKPSNILVTVNDGVAMPKVIDFGIAKATDQRLTDKSYFTEFHAFIGTPAYTSPEQAEMTSLDIDTRSDIYSLGVLLYELLTGQTPFPAERLLQSGLDEMRRIIREEEPPRPSTRLTTLDLAAATELGRKRQAKAPQLASVVEGDLDWIAMKALEKDRSRRYATSLDLAADLQRHLNNEAVIARPPSLLYKCQRTARRHKGAFSAIAAVLVALLTGLSLTAWQATRASRAEQIAHLNAEKARTDRDRAVLAESNAIVEAIKATNALLTANERTVKLNVAEGWRLVEEGDNLGALLPFAEAYALEENKPERAEIHQMRLASVLQHCPKLVNVWSVGTNVLKTKFNANGSKFLTVYGSLKTNRAIQCWDAITGKPVTSPVPFDDNSFVRWSGDGNRFLITFGPKELRVWDATTGLQISPAITTEESIWGCSLNQEGTRLLIHWRTSQEKEGTSNHRIVNPLVTLYDTVSGKVIWKHAIDIDEPSFSPGDRHLIANGRLFDASTGLERIASSNSYQVGFISQVDSLRVIGTPAEGYVLAGQPHAWILGGDDLSQRISLLPPRADEEDIEFDWSEQWLSPDGRWLVTKDSMGNRRGIRLWNVNNGAEFTPPTMNRNSLRQLCFSKDSRMMATLDSESQARIWDLSDEPHSLPLLKHESDVIGMAFNGVGRQLMTVCADGNVRLWDTRGTSTPQLTLPLKIEDPMNNDDAGVQLAFSDDGEMLAATTSESGGIWNLKVGDLIRSILALPRSTPCSLRFSSDRRRIYYSEASQRDPLVQEVSTGRLLSQPHVGTDSGRIHVSNDGKLVLRNGGDETNRTRLQVFRATTGELLTELRIDTEAHPAAFSPDGKLVVASLGKRMLYWSLNGNQTTVYLPIGDLPANLTRSIVQRSPDGRWLICLAGNSLTIWDPHSGERSNTATEGFFDRESAYPSPDGRRLLECRGSSVWLLDAFSGRPITPKMTSQGMVNAAGFSSDGKKIMTASADQQTRIWDATTGEQIVPNLLHPKAPVSALLNPNGHGVVTYDRVCIRYWEFPTANIPISDWLALAHFFSKGRGSDAGKTGSTFGSPRTTFRDEWLTLRAQHPEVFTVSTKEMHAWNRREAWRSESQNDWSNAVHHLSVLLERQSDSGEFLSRRAAAYEALAWSFVVSGVSQIATNILEHGVPAASGGVRNLATLAATDYLERAWADYNRTLVWVDRFPAIAKELRKPFVTARHRVLTKLNRRKEARSDFYELNNIPPRDFAETSLVDLDDRINVNLSPNGVPPGLSRLAGGVKFFICGAIVLASQSQPPNDEFPREVNSIPVQQTCRRLHFLHAARTTNEIAGVAIGKYVIHLSNGESRELAVKLGDDVWNREFTTTAPQPTKKSLVAWTGPAGDAYEKGTQARLFQSTWGNPLPSIPVQSIDFVSAMNEPSPMLYAITVEP